MPSPFPGMDPYLEQHWRDIHTSLIVYSRDQLQERLPPDLLARVEEGVTVDYGGEEKNRGLKPDVLVSEDEYFDSGPVGLAVATEASTVVVAEPLVLTVEEPPARHVEILDTSSGNRVVTVIEFLSPTNKLPGFGREEYARKQSDYLAAKVNLVEVDLIREGGFSVAVPQAELPKDYRQPYLISVRSATRPREIKVYRAPLRERLPAIRIPLRRQDRDVVLELQPLIDQCYARGRYDRINYAEDLDPPLSAEDAAWMGERLRAAGVR
ncbi:MAG: DUF4058 family protein [Planctomycetota bacterium]|nr:DUF4058 family protein [Planctomycetaceae bacterium]MDQ3333168.1 DUF4058 family protein [Planctomycetota bacterium]